MDTSLLIIVTYISGSAWGPQVTTQPLPSAQACTQAMHAVAEAIRGAAVANVNGEVRIESANGGVQVLAGLSQRTLAAVSCKVLGV